MFVFNVNWWEICSLFTEISDSFMPNFVFADDFFMFRTRKVDSCEITVANVDLDLIVTGFVLYFFVVIFAAGAIFGVGFGFSTNLVIFVAVVDFALMALFTVGICLLASDFVHFVVFGSVCDVPTTCFDDKCLISAENKTKKLFY